MLKKVKYWFEIQIEKIGLLYWRLIIKYKCYPLALVESFLYRIPMYIN